MLFVQYALPCIQFAIIFPRFSELLAHVHECLTSMSYGTEATNYIASLDHIAHTLVTYSTCIYRNDGSRFSRVFILLEHGYTNGLGA